MSILFLAEILEIHHPENYARYQQLVVPIVERHGGHYLARTNAIASPVGGPVPLRVILLEFPNREALQRCFGSEEYKQIAPLRTESTVSRSLVFEGEGV